MVFIARLWLAIIKRLKNPPHFYNTLFGVSKSAVSSVKIHSAAVLIFLLFFTTEMTIIDGSQE